VNAIAVGTHQSAFNMNQLLFHNFGGLGSPANAAGIGTGSGADIQVNGNGTVQVLPLGGTTEGIRIGRAANGYSEIRLGSSSNINDTGTNNGEWAIFTSNNPNIPLAGQNALTFCWLTNCNIGGGFVNPNFGGTVFGVSNLSAATGTSLCVNTGGSGVTINLIASCSSLRRLKSYIKPLTVGLDEVAKLRPVSYTSKVDWRKDPKTGKKWHPKEIGFIAEEVQAIDPRLSTYDADGSLRGVEYSHMVALLTKAIQEQQAEIEELKKQIEAKK
jgi:Chaperone of endosialidase